MTRTVTPKEIAKLLEGRKSALRLKVLFRSAGKENVFDALNLYAGDFPDTMKIRRLTEAFSLPESDLRRMSESGNSAQRRICRLILLGSSAGSAENTLLQKGLTDSNALIRTDSARFAAAGMDRTRLYNQLIKLIREDPDSRVRAAAGKRLAVSFADLYAVDFEGLPLLSRMLILDALEGNTRSDEERAEVLLLSKNKEASFRAARALQRWGTLGRLFESGTAEALSILEAAASNGVADYLENFSPAKSSRKELAVKLAGHAGRDDLVRSILGSRAPETPREDLSLRDIEELEKKLFPLSETAYEELAEELSRLPLDEANFRRSVTLAFPPPDKERITVVLYTMAALGGWNDWVPRIAESIDHEDPDIRRSAAASLAVLAPAQAIERLPSLLSDPVDRVRRSAARGLAVLSSEGGGSYLAEYLSGAPSEDEKESILAGIREAGGTAPARCILENAEYLNDAAKGDLLAHGPDGAAVKLLAEGITSAASLKKAAAFAGPRAGESFLKAWEIVDSSARKKLLSWTDSSGWASSLPLRLKEGGRNEKKLIRALLAPLNSEEKHALFDQTIEKAAGADKRRLKSLL